MDSLRLANPSGRGLKKNIGLLGVYALATGATISSGFFLLPGIAAHKAGPAVTIAYMLALLPLIPAMFSKVELSTAMPRAGGVYYFLDRSIGPLAGTIGGMGTWLALMLKTAFALVGMGVYLSIYIDIPIIPTAAGLAVLLTVINLAGAEKSGWVQILLVAILLPILLWFIGHGLPSIERSHFDGYFDSGVQSIFETAGLVYISYVGVTKVASVAEEIREPERNLPLGVFLSVATAAFIYCFGTIVMVGVIPQEALRTDHHPVATAAEAIAGPVGKGVVVGAALASFLAVANAGILSASRYPLAMSRDHLLPAPFRKLTSRGIPTVGLLSTLAVTLIFIFAFDVEKIAKLASAFQLLLFAFLCVAVIVMRESEIDSYDPSFRSPFYPWMQIMGVLISLLLILQMGQLTMLFSLGLVVLGTAWYFYYARHRVVRHGAIYHVFERLGRRRYEGLDLELRSILQEKGLREKDPYDEVIVRADVIDLGDEAVTFDELTRRVSELLAERIPGTTADELVAEFVQRNVDLARTVLEGAEVPHLRLRSVDKPELVIVRSLNGVKVREVPSGDDSPGRPELAYALLYLVSPKVDPAQHLRILAQIATHLDDDEFSTQWDNAADDHELKEILLRDERFLHLELLDSGKTSELIGHRVREVPLHGGCLVALIRRDGESIVPDGNAELELGDVLTVIGQPRSIRHLYHEYVSTGGGEMASGRLRREAAVAASGVHRRRTSARRPSADSDASGDPDAAAKPDADAAEPSPDGSPGSAPKPS